MGKQSNTKSAHRGSAVLPPGVPPYVPLERVIRFWQKRDLAALSNVPDPRTFDRATLDRAHGDFVRRHVMIFGQVDRSRPRCIESAELDEYKFVASRYLQKGGNVSIPHAVSMHSYLANEVKDQEFIRYFEHFRSIGVLPK